MNKGICSECEKYKEVIVIGILSICKECYVPNDWQYAQGLTIDIESKKSNKISCKVLEAIKNKVSMIAPHASTEEGRSFAPSFVLRTATHLLDDNIKNVSGRVICEGN